jgi:hypothetical protein
VTSSSEIGLLRLVAQRIAGPRLPSAVEAVRLLTCVQGQDYPGALTSVALRTTVRSRAEVEGALDDGHVVRTWPMRGTLHFLPAEDVGWLIGLLGPRVLAGAPARRQQLGITDASVEEARLAAVGALSGNRRLRRGELLAALGDAGVDVTGQRGYHLLWYLSQTGTLCLGPTDDGEQCWVLVEEWLGPQRTLEPDEALHRLADRFFRGHGPATIKDLVRWAGIRVTEARGGLASVRAGLATLDVDGTEHYLDPATPDLLTDCRAEARGTFLLPGFDEFVLGYGDRSAVLEPEHFQQIVPGSNGMFRPTVVHQGRIVGTWGWAGRGATRVVTATPFTSWPKGVEARIPDLASSLPA